MLDDLVVHRVLDSLSIDFKQLKVFYIALIEKWSIDELIKVFVQEVDRLSRKRDEKAHLTLVAPSKKRKSSNEMFKFQNKNNKAITKSFRFLECPE